MSLKFKLTSTIVAFFLILGLVLIGVFAAPQATIILGGNLNFKATNVHAKVTGSVSGAENASTVDLPDLTFMEGRDTNAEQTHTANVEKWGQADLKFTEAGNAIEIVLTIENLATDRPVYGTISLDSEMTTSVKSTITRVASESATTGEPYQAGELITLQPQADGNTSKLYFRLVIELKDKNTSLLSTDKWGYDIALDSTTTKEGVTNSNTMLAYTKTEYNTLSVGAGTTTPSGTLEIKDYILVDGLTYAVTTIGDFAFDGCDSLTGNLTIPSSVTSIGDSAFNYCSGLTGTLTIPSSVTSIGNSAFHDCSKLTGTLTIPSSVTNIGNSAFSGCSGFNGNITISNGVTSIGNYAFQNCSNLTGGLIIPSSVTSIGDAAFMLCRGLTSVTIPSSVTTLKMGVFAHCTALTSVTLAEGITSIGVEAFSTCSKLTSIFIPETITEILGYAFDGSGLTTVTIDSQDVVDLLTSSDGASSDGDSSCLITTANTINIRADLNPTTYLTQNYTLSNTLTTINGVPYKTYTK